jgi:hypothetical protein
VLGARYLPDVTHLMLAGLFVGVAVVAAVGAWRWRRWPRPVLVSAAGTSTGVVGGVSMGRGSVPILTMGIVGALACVSTMLLSGPGPSWYRVRLGQEPALRRTLELTWFAALPCFVAQQFGWIHGTAEALLVVLTCLAGLSHLGLLVWGRPARQRR